MNLFSLILSFFIAISPSPQFDCDGERLLVTIRNNLNGDFALVTDLEEIDEGAFVVLDWNNLSLMLPVSFQKGEISFTDKKWLWSYQDEKNGLRMDEPRFAQLLPNGDIQEFSCQALYTEDSIL